MCEIGEIDKKYAELKGPNGFLGAPISNEMVCPDGIGRYRHYANGSIYCHPLTGAHEVHGLIREKWKKLGWEKSVLGYPKTDESDSPVKGGKYNLFQGGTILWVPGSKEAFEVHGAIRSKWGNLGWESGFLGFPTTDESVTPDKIGRYNHFQGGSIYWKPSISAHEIHGLILKYWAEHGYEKNPDLGYPISDELAPTENSKNRYSDFENGVLYWKYGSNQAVPLYKTVLGGASKTVNEVMEEIKKFISPKISTAKEVYIRKGPYLSQVTDYSFDGKTVHNRMYKVRVDLGYDVPVLADPTSNLDLWIEISYDKTKKSVNAYLRDWHVHTHVPSFTSAVIKAKEINNKIKAALDPMLGKPQKITGVPDGINILSLKTMQNGDLNVYIEPLS